MLRSLLTATTKSPLRSLVPLSRSVSCTAVRMGEGDTGGTRAGGAAASDAFSKRETANESKYVKERELEKLRELKARIQQQRDHLNELDKQMDDMTSKDHENEGKGK